MQPLNLTHFVIQYNISVPEVLLAAVSSPSLRVLEVLANYESDALYLIRRPIDWHLEELSVTAAMVEYSDFATFLHKTPSIRTLFVGALITAPPFVPVLSLRLSSLPKLERLMCYPMLLPHLIRVVRSTTSASLINVFLVGAIHLSSLTNSPLCSNQQLISRRCRFS
jgi:hypothetical protein